MKGIVPNAKAPFNPGNPKDGSTICLYADLCPYLRCVIKAFRMHDPQERIPISLDENNRPHRHW